MSSTAEGPVAPQADLDLDVRTLRSWLAVDDDGDPVLVLKDADVAVIVDFGLGGSWDNAIRGAERLSDTALAYASKLRDLMMQGRGQSGASWGRLTDGRSLDVGAVKGPRPNRDA